MIKNYRDTRKARSAFVFGSRFNVIVLNTHNSLEHELLKVKYAYNLAKSGYDFACEQELKNGAGRPDLVMLREEVSECIAFEFMDTETESSIAEKRKKYPFAVEPVRVGD